MTGPDTPRLGLDGYLARLDAALAPVPAAERQEILLETRSHVLERTSRAPARTVEEVLAELGPPESYARRFLPEGAAPHREAIAPPARQSGDTFHRFARLATSGPARLPLFGLVVSAYAIAALAFAVAVDKVLEPDATGVFVSSGPGRHRTVQVFWSDPQAAGRDVLGWWLVPIGLLVALAIHLAVSGLLRRLLRDEPPAPEPPARR